jgi:acyl dehydratase
MNDASATRRLHYEDFAVDQAYVCAPRTVTRDEIVAFASEYDAQPFHVDEEAAKASFFGGLVASGWHTASLGMRAIADRVLLDTAGLGSPGIEELKWIRPVRAGDVITVTAHIREKKDSRSRPQMGLVRFFMETRNQNGELVMTQDNWIMIERRAAS